jgi:hypothetical protein
VTQPAISATNDSGPAIITARKNQGDAGSRLLRYQVQMNTTPSSARNVPIAAMVWNP